MVTTQEEYEKLRSKDLVVCRCENKDCGKEFNALKKNINYVLKFPNNDRIKIKFCSHKCNGVNQQKKVKDICQYENCKKEFSRNRAVYKKHKTHFCSKSCAGFHNAKNRMSGKKRSKFEIILEIELKNKFPLLPILYNNKKIIGSELDIFIPSLNLGIEINGIFHYQPIFGEDKLRRTQINDEQKKNICNIKNIEFHTFDISKIIYNINKNFIPTFNQIFELINTKLNSYGASTPNPTEKP